MSSLHSASALLVNNGKMDVDEKTASRKRNISSVHPNGEDEGSPPTKKQRTMDREEEDVEVVAEDTEMKEAASTATDAPKAVDASKIELFPREWVERSEKPDGKFSFTMMSFNVLADGLSGSRSDQGRRDKTFVHVPIEHLAWEFRGPRIVAEIMRWEPDVICLEEVDQFEFLFDRLQPAGYDGRFKGKEFSPCLRMNPPLPADGVALLWKKDKFELIGVHETKQERPRIWVPREIAAAVRQRVEDDDPFSVNVAIKHLDKVPNLVTEAGTVSLSELSSVMGSNGPLSMPTIKELLGVAQDADVVDRETFVDFMKQPSSPVSISVRLRSVSSPDVDLLVMGTHLVSAKELNGEMQRRRQLERLLHDDEMRALMGKKEETESPHLFIGCDMNSAPFATMGYPPLSYRYIVGKRVAEDEQVSDEAKEMPGSTFERPLRSAMRGDGDSELPYTTWKHRQKIPGKIAEDKHTIDFLFYPDQGWDVTKVLSIPTEADVEEERKAVAAEKGIELPSALPSRKYPSDHFAVVAEFAQH